LNESVKRATSPDELIFRSDVSLGELQHMKQMRDSKKEVTYKMWDDLIEKGQKIDEDVIRMLQNYVIMECHSDNLENIEYFSEYISNYYGIFKKEKKYYMIFENYSNLSQRLFCRLLKFLTLDIARKGRRYRGHRNKILLVYVVHNIKRQAIIIISLL
jgi:hypothetical protein